MNYIQSQVEELDIEFKILEKIFAECAELNYKIRLRCERAKALAQVSLFASIDLAKLKPKGSLCDFKEFVHRYERVTKRVISRANERKYLNWTMYDCTLIQTLAVNELGLDPSPTCDITEDQIKRIREKCNLIKPLRIPQNW